MKKGKRLNVKLTLLYACFALLIGAFICVFSYRITWDLATSMYSEKAEQAAALVATYVDGDHVGSYIQSLTKDEAYEALQEKLNTTKEELDLLYLYIFVPGTDSFVYVMDAQTEEDDPAYISSLGDVFEYTELEYTYLVPDVEAKRGSQEVIIASESLFFGSGVSAWAPVLDSQGEVAAMVEADFSLEQVSASIRSSIILLLAVFAALIAVVVLVQSLAIRRMVTVPLKKLTDRTLTFASEGTLSDFEDDIRTGDELQVLSEAFGQMASDIVSYTEEKADLAATKERIATELEVASDIQQSMLPETLGDFSGKKYLEIHGDFRGSKRIGGNFYDYFLLDDHRVGLTLCGMESSGIPAAMLLVVVRTIIKSQFSSERSLADTMGEINRQVYQTVDGKRPISAFVGVLDTEAGVFSYINAGYNPPVVMRQGERYDFLASQTYAPLGISENVLYRELTMELRHGDRLLLYSAGIINAKAPDGERFGAERLRGRLNESRNRGLVLEDMDQDIIKAVSTFTGKPDPEDDLVLLSLAYQRDNRDLAQLILPPDMDRANLLQDFLKEQLRVNRIQGKDYARLLVCAEELFSLCCKYASGSRVEVECAVPSSNRLELRLTANLWGNPLEDTRNSAVQSAVSFLRKYADRLELIELENRRFALVMAKELSQVAAEIS